jgi:hypothetical protein
MAKALVLWLSNVIRQIEATKFASETEENNELQTNLNTAKNLSGKKARHFQKSFTTRSLSSLRANICGKMTCSLRSLNLPLRIGDFCS